MVIVSITVLLWAFQTAVCESKVQDVSTLKFSDCKWMTVVLVKYVFLKILKFEGLTKHITKGLIE